MEINGVLLNIIAYCLIFVVCGYNLARPYATVWSRAINLAFFLWVTNFIIYLVSEYHQILTLPLNEKLNWYETTTNYLIFAYLFLVLLERRRDNIYTSIFDNTPTGIILIDKNGIITNANKKALNLSQYQLSEITGKHIDMLLPKNRRKGHAEKVKKFVNGGDRILPPVEVPMLRKDGKQVKINLAVGTMRGVFPHERIGIGVIG